MRHMAYGSDVYSHISALLTTCSLNHNDFQGAEERNLQRPGLTGAEPLPGVCVCDRNSLPACAFPPRLGPIMGARLTFQPSTNVSPAPHCSSPPPALPPSSAACRQKCAAATPQPHPGPPRHREDRHFSGAGVSHGLVGYRTGPCRGSLKRRCGPLGNENQPDRAQGARRMLKKWGGMQLSSRWNRVNISS